MNDELISEIRELVANLSLCLKDYDQSADNFKILIHPETLREIVIDYNFHLLTQEVGVEQTISKSIGLKCEISTSVNRLGVCYEKQ